MPRDFRTETGHVLPGIVTRDNRVRLLAAHPSRGMLQGARRVKDAAPTLPRSAWPKILPIGRRRAGVPLRDQLQVGSCLPNAFASALMMQRDAQGFSPALLSACYVYAHVNGGADVGSYPEDAIQCLVARGTCLEPQCPEGSYLLSQVAPGADDTASRFRLADGEWYAMETWEELVTATILGWHWAAPVFVVDAWYDVGPDGNAPAVAGQGNHETCGGEVAAVASNGEVVLASRNSWGTSWGMQGYYWYREAHMAHQPNWRAYALKAAAADPSDPRIFGGMA